MNQIREIQSWSVNGFFLTPAMAVGFLGSIFLFTQSITYNQDVLKTEAQQRLEVAGVEVVDARLTHLAYAPEIAQAMLRRQQAGAVIAAKERIVEGAMGMVEMALNRLSEQRVVELDEERKAAMVNNLLVAIVSEGATQPIINTGTLYT